MKSEKKTEPLALTLEQLIEEPREEISAVASAPIPKEELEDTAVAVPTEKPYCDTIAVEKINPHAGEAESELPPEIPPSPEETEIISSTQNTATGQAPRLLTRLETFQKKCRKSFRIKSCFTDNKCNRRILAHRPGHRNSASPKTRNQG